MEEEKIKILIEKNLNSGYAKRKKHLENMEEIDKEIKNEEKMYTIVIALVLAVLYDVLFKGKSYGISYSIFTILFIIFFLWSIREKVKVVKSMGWFLLIPIFLLTLNFSVYSNVILSFFNGVGIPILVVGSTILIAEENREWHTAGFLFEILKRAWLLTFENMAKPFGFIKSNINFKEVKLNSTKKNILKGLLISVPLLAVILMLLTSADMVFQYYISNLSNVFNGMDAENFMWHFMLISFVSLYIFGYIWSFKYPCVKEENTKSDKKGMGLDSITILTIIFVINIVYLIFTMIQFSYLYGSAELPAAFTYAEYARKGFFELVAVTILNLSILLFSMKHIKVESKVLNKVANLFLSFLVLFTVNMLFSAHFKMTLYENTYGFTYLRIFVHIFMLFLLLLFVIAFLGIWNKRVPVIKAGVILSIAMYVILNYINVDVIIAEKNIERYYKTQNIDIEYLTNLSYDALPIIKKLEGDPNATVSNAVKSYLQNEKYKLSKEHSWWEFNYSKYKAKKSLKD